MSRTKTVGACIVCALWIVGAGCQQPKGDMAEMMKPPPRPAELDKLDMLVGRWEGNFEFHMGDKVMKGTGTNTTLWDADKWVLLEREEGSMGDMGKHVGLGFWSWDSKARVFRTAYSNNHGEFGEGTVTYDENSRIWHMKGREHGLMGDSVGEGTFKMVGPDSMEWNFTMWDGLKLRKLATMTGTSKRVGGAPMDHH
ncbi:MAG TPA: hypothetical protein VGM03_19365 [Phycisphaerae bacterium]|jgi:hypothetical protein